MHAAVLRYIDQVARNGSIRRAARALNVASSAVNRQILNLEAEFNVSLFERIGNGVRPTEAGWLLIRHARETMDKMEEVKAAMTSLSGDMHGEVRILTFPAPLVRLVPRAIEQVARRHPNIVFKVVDATPADQVEDMRAGRPDIAVLFVDKRRKGYDVIGNIHARIGAIMRPDHPLADRSEVTLTDCAAHPVIMLSNPWLLDAIAETQFHQSGAQFRATMTTNSLPMTKNMLKAGLGIAFFTPTGFVEELRAGELSYVPLSERDLSTVKLGLLVHRRRSDWPPVQAFNECLLNEFEALQRDINELEKHRVQRCKQSSVSSAHALPIGGEVDVAGSLPAAPG